MKKFILIFAIPLVMLFLATFAHADCGGGPNLSCVVSFSISGEPLKGDGQGLATGSVTAHLGQGSTTLVLVVQEYNAVGNSVFLCGAGGSINGTGCTYPNVGSDPTVTFSFNGVNNGTTDITGYITVQVYGFPQSVLQANTRVTPAGSPTTPAQEPDACTSTHPVGRPINAASGNTWITQQDYSIPGLGGGLALTRTWSSLWPLMQPPEESGIFGDSWRSNFEERIQVLTGGVVYIGKVTAADSFTFTTAYRAHIV